MLYTLLRWCCDHGDDEELANLALQAGASPNDYSPPASPLLHIACIRNCPRITKALLGAHANSNQAVVYKPCKKGDSKTTKTALEFAIRAVNPKIIQILLEAGADFEVVCVQEGVTLNAMQVHRIHLPLVSWLYIPTQLAALK